MAHQRAYYRPNVAMVILNRASLVLWAKRRDMDAWQFPQGGIKPGETPEQAMHRELREETGIRPGQVQVLATTKGWIRYEVPKHKRHSGAFVGQEQKWFLLRLLAGDEAVNLRATKGAQEFDDWKWASIGLVLKQVVDFKREAYARALDEFSALMGLPARDAPKG